MTSIELRPPAVGDRPVAVAVEHLGACGAYGRKVTDPKDVAEAVREALAHPGPALVDCDVNPNEPPMPGKVKYQQAKAFTEAFLRGQPHKMATLATVARDKINQLRS